MTEDKLNEILDLAEIDFAGTLEDRLDMLLLSYNIALLEIERLKIELKQYQ